MTTGFIYVLSNVSMPGLVKIGRTDRTLEQRMRELNTTGVPTPFVVEFSVVVNDTTTVEKQIHALLTARGIRASNNREFFVADVYDAITAVKAIAALYLPSASGRDTEPSLQTIFNLAKRPEPYKPLEYEEFLPYEEKFREIGEAGLPEAYLELSSFFIRIYPSTLKWRHYSILHLEELRKQTSGVTGQLNTFELQSCKLQGLHAANHLIFAYDIKGLMDVDFEIISEFLCSGNQQIYDAYINMVDRPTFPASIKQRALDL